MRKFIMLITELMCSVKKAACTKGATVMEGSYSKDDMQVVEDHHIPAKPAFQESAVWKKGIKWENAYVLSITLTREL